jgi:hypothetical protein
MSNATIIEIKFSQVSIERPYAIAHTNVDVLRILLIKALGFDCVI